MRGRKPTPTAILKLHGSWRAKLRDDEPEIQPSQRLVCPQMLKDEARRHWFLIVPQLLKAGFLTKLDTDSLVVYCQLFAEYIKAINILEKSSPVIKNRMGNFCQNPIVRVVNQLADRIVSIGSELGLTPAARAGMGRRGHREPFENGIEKYVSHYGLKPIK